MQFLCNVYHNIIRDRRWAAFYPALYLVQRVSAFGLHLPPDQSTACTECAACQTASQKPEPLSTLQDELTVECRFRQRRGARCFHLGLAQESGSGFVPYKVNCV